MMTSAAVTCFAGYLLLASTTTVTTPTLPYRATSPLSVPGGQTERCAREPDCDPVRRGHALAPVAPAFTIEHDVAGERHLGSGGALTPMSPKERWLQIQAALAVSGDEIGRTAGRKARSSSHAFEGALVQRPHDAVAAGPRDAEELRPHGRHRVPILTGISRPEPSARRTPASATTAHTATGRTHTPMSHKERWLQIQAALTVSGDEIGERPDARPALPPMLLKERWFKDRTLP